jgi:cytochrome c oxidase subunit 6b
MGAAQSFSNFPLTVARAEEEAPSAVEEAAAPPPPSPVPKNPTLASLSEDELEELKQEIVNETVAKIAGDDGEKLADLLEPSMETAPYDPRFPNRNQARHCFVRYNEYHKCVFERGEEHERCQFYQRAYQSICPADWLEQWGELRDKGLWTGKY